MSTRLPWLALAAGAYLAFSFSQFPAATAIRWFAPEQFRASGISGTIWQGSAALASLPGIPMRDLRWSISGPSLLIGRLSGDLSARLSSGFVETGFSASFGSASLREMRVGTSLVTFAGLLPLRGTRGQVAVDLGRLTIVDGWPSEAVGSVRISSLEVEPFAGAGNQMIRLGDYEASFNDESAPIISAEIRDTGGPLELNGTLQLFPNREYDLSGQLRPRADAQPELVQGLSIMLPPPDANGFRNFSWPGSL
jgi:general secretion pathway protein N